MERDTENGTSMSRERFNDSFLFRVPNLDTLVTTARSDPVISAVQRNAIYFVSVISEDDVGGGVVGS